VTLRRVLLGVLVLAGLAGYALLSHLATSADGSEAFPGFRVLLALGPLWFFVVIAAWRASYRWLWIAVVLMVTAAGARYLDVLAHNVSWLYFLQHAGTNALLALFFGKTLLRTHTPLCTRFYVVVHGTLTPYAAGYTRAVTLAWTIFFGVMCGTSVVLFTFASVEAWSVLANLLTGPLVGLMFAAEYLVRQRRAALLPPAGIMDGIRAYWKSGKPGPAATTAADPHC